MRNQKLLAKAARRIAMRNANIVTGIRMLIRKYYLKLGTLLKMQCRHILNRLQQVHLRCIYILINELFPKWKIHFFLLILKSVSYRESMMDCRYANFKYNFLLH